MQTHTPLTLPVVKAAFLHWRQCKKQSAKDRIPEALWEQVRQIAPQHKVHVIKKTLSISSSQWQQHIKPSLANTPAKNDHTQLDFLTLVPHRDISKKTSMTAPTPNTASLVVEIQGTQKKVCLHAHTDSVVAAVLQQLLTVL